MSRVFTIAEGLENMGALRTGGQGSVYKGRRMGPIITAVKLLPTPITSEDNEDKNFRNFKNEVEKLKKVNEQPNPNVVKILSSGITESGSLPYIEMEFIEGPDLEELLQPPHDKIFSLKEVLKLADHLANALAHCHLVGVKHGDVKSNNVKYNVHSGNYMLLDFGLAIMSDEQRRTSIRHAGAIEFMAPEQNNGAMHLQTDIYSYGIILYELLAGQVPFPLHDNGETARNAVMIAHMEEPVPDLMELRKKNLPEDWSPEKKEQEMRVPQWLLHLIDTCLQKDYEKRYSNGMALQEALYVGSIDMSGYDAGYQSLDLLKTQNQQLADRLEYYQVKQSYDARFVKISRTAAIVAVIVLLAGLVFGTYGVLKKQPVYNIIKKDTIIRRPIIVIHRDTVRRKPVIKNAVADSDSTAMPKHVNKKPHKKKRKKFLGIF